MHLNHIAGRQGEACAADRFLFVLTVLYAIFESVLLMFTYCDSAVRMPGIAERRFPVFDRPMT